MPIPMTFECTACGWTEEGSFQPSRCPGCDAPMEVVSPSAIKPDGTKRGGIMLATHPSRRIIGVWKGAVRVLTICPHCPRIVTEHSMEDFREMVGAGPQEDYRPICPICHQTGFIYLEHSGEMEWFRDGLRHSFRFIGWEHPLFLEKIARLFGAKSAAYRTIENLSRTEF